MLTVAAVLATWTAGSAALALVVGGIVRLREHDAHGPEATANTQPGVRGHGACPGVPAPVG